MKQQAKGITLSLPQRQKPYLMAHRGVMAHEPENTLRSFQRALEAGADILETDLHLTADGVPVCIHDPTVDRTTNGQGKVGDMQLEALRQLRTVDPAGQVTQERIPTLDELLALVPEGRAVALEIKDDRLQDPLAAEQVVAALEAHGLKGQSVVLSFQRRHLVAMQRAAPWLPAGLITMGNYSPFQAVQLLGPHPKILYWNRFYVRIAHLLNRLVCPLDPWPDARLEWYLKMGVDALLTNDPAATAQALALLRSS